MYKKELLDLFEFKNQSNEYSIHTLLSNKKLITYGMGNGYNAFMNVMNRENIKPFIILDNKFLIEEQDNSIIRTSINNCQLTQEEKDNSLVVVTIGDFFIYKNVYNTLTENGFKYVIKSSDIFEFNIHHLPEELKEKGNDFYLEKKDDIVSCFDLLEDAISKQVFLSILKIYTSHRPEEIVKDSGSFQYFPKGIPLNRFYDRFINCGAYDGDTIKALNFIFGTISSLICFEPDQSTFNKLSLFLQKESEKIAEHIIACPCGVYETTTQLSFSSDKLLCSSIFDEGNSTIQCVSLDSFLPNFDPTFISMDIEGAEIFALKGAERILRKSKPDLGISIYHFPNHLWDVLLFIHGLNLGYKFYIRNYTGFTYETILYATVKGG